MASCSTYAHAFPVNFLAQRTRFNHVKASSSSSIKPNLKELPQIPSLMDVPKLMKETSAKLFDKFIDLTFEIIDQQLHPLQSNFAPVDEIGEAVVVTAIQGKIPDDFPEGIYIRNGPNPYFGALRSSKSIFGRASEIWVEGEGMVHSLYFTKDGSGSWNTLYNNKYVQTDTLKMEKERNKPLFLPLTEGDGPAVIAAYILNLLRCGAVHRSSSSTIVFEHGGKFYSTSEDHMPQEIDIVTLETLDNWEFTEAWNRPFGSHPKKAPGSGELLIAGFEPQKPYYEIAVISADGKKFVHRVDLKFERCTFSHDIGITERYNVILDFPVTIDLNRVLRGGPLVKYDSKEFARIGVMPRYGDADSVKWFEVEPCSVFHLVNCFEDGDEVVMRGCKARGAIIPGPEFGLDKFEWFSRGFKALNLVNDENSQDGALFARVHEWRLNMKTGEIKEKRLTGDERSMDFPMINESFVGIKNKYGYTQVINNIASSNSGLAKYGGLAKLSFDERNIEHSSEQEMAKIEYHEFPANTFCTGATFAPKPGGLEEDDGWIIAFVHNEDTNTSQAYIVDAKKFSGEPVAIIAIPARVPYGFHGSFMSMNSKN